MDGADKQKLQDNAAGFSGLVGALDEFKDTKKALRGTGWNEFRKAICGFRKPLSNMQLYSTELEENVQSCMNEINRELDGYTGGISVPSPINFGTVFDDISTKRTACNNNIATLQEKLYVDVPINIEITDSKYERTWIDKVVIRFHKGFVSLFINSIRRL